MKLVGARTCLTHHGCEPLLCEACSEYLIGDVVFAKVEELLSGVDAAVELEIIPFAA